MNKTSSYQNNDVSMNQTYLDGSVIIHTGNSLSKKNTDANYGNADEGYNHYYGANENNMQKNVNISWFDGMNSNHLGSSETTSNKNNLTNRTLSKAGGLGLKQYSTTSKSGKSDQEDLMNYRTNDENLYKMSPPGRLLSLI